MGPQVVSGLLGWHEGVSVAPITRAKSTLTRGRSQPIAADEVQTFKALITIHRVLQEGHVVALREAMAHRNWIDSLKRSVSGEGVRGYGPLIHEYVYYILAKLSFHHAHQEFNGTFEYEEYISLKAINDPNEGYETISDLMALQDKIEQFQKLIFSHFRHVGNNECRISALVPLVQESYGIYRFITSMLRAMHSSRCPMWQWRYHLLTVCSYWR
jgi:huntingtin-interacting protein 1-related protein